MLLLCGEDPITIESEFVTVGAQASTVEQLASGPISLGDTGMIFIIIIYIYYMYNY